MFDRAPKLEQVGSVLPKRPKPRRRSSSKRYIFAGDSQGQFDAESDLLRSESRGVGLPSAESKIAIHRVDGNCANTIINITVSGAARNAPAMPQISPQIASASKTTTAERFNESPVMRGCTKFP